MSSFNRKKHLKSVTNKISIFHNGEEFICQTRETRVHNIDGYFVFKQQNFYVTTLSRTGPDEQKCDKKEYLSKLAQLRSEGCVEEKYEYGFKFSDSFFKDRQPYSHEYFGEEPPDISETLKRFENARDEKINRLRAFYSCKVCRGKGSYDEFVGYSKRIIGTREAPNTLVAGTHTVPVWEEFRNYKRTTCPVCGGRGYDIEAVLLSLK